MQEHYVKTIHNSGLSFTSSIGDHAVPIDASAEHGGQNSGASPKKLMLASLAGCTGIDVVMLLDKMKAVYSDFSIDISASLTDEHPKIYKDVVVPTASGSMKKTGPRWKKRCNCRKTNTAASAPCSRHLPT